MKLRTRLACRRNRTPLLGRALNSFACGRQPGAAAISTSTNRQSASASGSRAAHDLRNLAEPRFLELPQTDLGWNL